AELFRNRGLVGGAVSGAGCNLSEGQSRRPPLAGGCHPPRRRPLAGGPIFAPALPPEAAAPGRAGAVRGATSVGRHRPLAPRCWGLAGSSPTTSRMAPRPTRRICPSVALSACAFAIALVVRVGPRQAPWPGTPPGVRATAPSPAPENRIVDKTGRCACLCR